jgi:hypothetical protein
VSYILPVEWDVEFTDEFEEWWESLAEGEQVRIAQKVRLLQQFGPSLPRPHADSIASSRHSNMRELIAQHKGRPYRVLYAFDPRRCAVLLIGGDKSGDAGWYLKYVPVTDRIFDEHLERLRKEGIIDG